MKLSRLSLSRGISMTDSLEGICLVMSTCMDTTRLSPIR